MYGFGMMMLLWLLLLLMMMMVMIAVCKACTSGFEGCSSEAVIL